MWPRMSSVVYISARIGASCMRGIGVLPMMRVCNVGLVNKSQVCGVQMCHPVIHPPPTPLRLIHTTSSTAEEFAVVVDDGEVDRLYSAVDVECRGHDPAVLRSYLTFLSSAAAHLGINVEDVAWPKKHIKRWTLLKSVHIHKKHRVQYEARTHFLTFSLPRLTQSTTDTYLEYIQRNLPEGVAMKVTRHELQKLPQHVKPSPEAAV